MKRFVSFFAIFMVALSYLILTALIGYSLKQSWDTNEVTTTAEIIEILETDFTQIKTTRIAIFDSIKPEVGRCFTNAETICVALNKAGYPAEQYVGWLFMEDELPIHHSFVVLYGHILDLSISMKSEDFAKLDSMTKIYKTKDEAREYIAEYILQKEQLPNHQRCIFGVVDKMYHYIGAPGTREDGIKRNKELRKIYPQHPCFQDVKNGITRGQEILLRKK